MAEWMLQTSLYPDDPLVLDSYRNSGWAFVSSMWDPSVFGSDRGDDIVTGFVPGMVWFNLAVLAFCYATLIVAVNRFWIATWLFAAVVIVYAVADYVKVEERIEPILPADLAFVGGGNAGKVASFIPADDMPLVHGAIKVVAAGFLLMLAFNHFDCRRSVIAPAVHRRLGAGVRCAALLLALAVGGVFAHDIMREGTWASNLTVKAGYDHVWWEMITDARHNGTFVSFLELVDATPMNEPDGYSRDAMEEIAGRYQAEASAINETRSQNMTDSTVVLVLSESFIDPTAVPGVTVAEDPVPFLHELERTTTSGRMLSSGYGGGTANMEYMSLTGLSMTNFSSTLTTPYQQLVPTESWTPSFNQPWGTGNSLGMHPYVTTMYSRNLVYRKFGFRSLRSLDNASDTFWPQDHADASWYVSDESAYRGALNELRAHSDPEFISLITMQNHAPYYPWYGEDDIYTITYTPTGATYAGDSWIQTYVKGTSLTDEATREFLGALDAMDRPVTVIFYGDHYPSVFEDSASDPANLAAMHETPYFIWSNAASASAGTRLIRADSAYTSPNYFMAQAAEHMDARVSPYLAFLTRMHEQIPAMAVGISDGTDTDETGSGAYYMAADGTRITEDELTDEQRAMLADYRLIQYDITTGKNYLKDMGFMDLPGDSEP